MAEMNIVQRALANLLAPAVAGATSAALTQIRARLDALEQRPTITDAERETIAKAGAMVAQLEALAEGQFEMPAPAPADPGGGSVTVEDVPAP